MNCNTMVAMFSSSEFDEWLACPLFYNIYCEQCSLSSGKVFVIIVTRYRIFVSYVGDATSMFLYQLEHCFTIGLLSCLTISILKKAGL